MHERASYKNCCDLILDECRAVLAAVNAGAIGHYLDLLLQAEKVFFVGTGRVHLSLSSTAVRYRHLNIDSFVVGQIGSPPIGAADLLVAASGSGESVVPIAMAMLAKAKGAKIAHIGSNPHSTLAQLSDLFVRIPANTKLALDGEMYSAQPMTSLFEQALLLFGDAIAYMIVREKALDPASLWKMHSNLE